MPPRKSAPNHAAVKAEGAAAKRGAPKAKAAACKIVKKPAKLTPKAKDDMKLMKSLVQTVKMELPADWPEGAIPNARAFAPLPEGWHHAKKATKASARGTGGLLRPCFVGPQGKLFWHKKDMYKYLGQDMPKEDLSEIRRPMNPLVQKEFPPDAVLHRTETRTGTEYIDKRCDGLDGLSVQEALLDYRFQKHSATRNYNLSDLRYDIEGGRIVVEAAGHQASKCAEAPMSVKVEFVAEPPTKRARKSAPTKPAPTKPAPTPAKRPAPKAAKKFAPALKGAKKPAAVPPLAEVQVGGSCGSSDPYVPRDPAVPTPLSKNTDAGKEVQLQAEASLQHIQLHLLNPLMKQRASGTEGELAICTLVGRGQMYGIDDCILKVLPDVLRKEPSERSAFGKAALEQFQAELRQRV